MTSLLSSFDYLYEVIVSYSPTPSRPPKKERSKRGKKGKRRKKGERKERKLEQRKGYILTGGLSPSMRSLGPTPLGYPSSVLPAYKRCFGLPLLPADAIYTLSAWGPKSILKIIQFLSSATVINLRMKDYRTEPREQGKILWLSSKGGCCVCV